MIDNASDLPRVAHRFAEVDGLRIFYREAGPVEGPVLLLLHGFPSASHQFRRLIDTLGRRYRVIAPDYPGFGHSDAPPPEEFAYTFDALADVMEGFCRALGLSHFVAYLFDFGGPVGFRLATRHPEWIAGLVVQNANAYEEGLSEAARAFVAEEDESRIRDFLTLPATRGQYEDGAGDVEAVDPDAWTLDQHFLDLPGRREIQVRLALDYRGNLALYPRWQEWLRTHQPPALVVWGRGDGIFTEAGARAYLRDLPRAELHLLDAGHFALVERLPQVAPLVGRFLDELPRVDRTEVVDALHRFALGQDRKDRELFASAFAPDAEVDFRPAAERMGVGSELMRGRETIVDTILGLFAGRVDTTHQVTNARVRLVGAGTGTAELTALVEAQHLLSADHSRHVLLKNHYVCEVVRDGSRWLLRRVRIENAWYTGDPRAIFGDVTDSGAASS
ncbi:alpha/beta fold hydrolase [Streptomyces sp. 6N223]|uniref:alpha/beta fold hydrolase n=1 Tax=Streptomyces sp. 6N223 TaxID=3457412 RepID=UPI003FD2CE8D